ncbi:hypothetical protein KAR91_70690 [Candidatus Pacearchaeota archaeon]|nr:hypothetical protein [Candidatus Pacearchaeota archaeon]
MEKVNLVESNLVKGEYNCCHRRSNNIVKEYGMCIECLCSEEYFLPKFTKRQRENTIANINTIIGALVIFFIYKFTGDSANQIASSVIMWFVYFTIASILMIYIYNHIKESIVSLKKEIRKFIDLGALIYFQS